MHISGIHHVTGICGPAKKNYDFYAKVLGLRFVKKTVNFDDPGTYHLYYGNEAGEPGSILTFFPWENAVPGSNGVGMVTSTAFTIPVASTGFWVERFVSHGIQFNGPLKRMDETAIGFIDPDGLPLELVGDPEAGASGWAGGGVPAEHAIRAFHSASLGVWEFDFLEGLFTQTFGYQLAAEEENRRRFVAPGGEQAGIIDLVSGSGSAPPRQGTGTIHHIAFRAKDEGEQLEWREKVLSAGLRVTAVRDRQYFKSIYFREPGGILFEIATDPPGFTLDEPLEDLGTALKLPPWLEERRAEIEAELGDLEQVEGPAKPEWNDGEDE